MREGNIIMILCEYSNNIIHGFELSPKKDDIKKFREEQLAQNFKIYSATTNTPNRLTDDNFKAQNVNGIAIKEGLFHVLEMYSYNNENLSLYEQVWEKYINGDYDSLDVYTVSQEMKLSNDVHLVNILRFLIIDDYKKLNVNASGPNKDLYQAKIILQLNEKLHMLQLLFRDTPVQLNSTLQTLNYSEESLNAAMANFNFNQNAVFSLPVEYLDQMQRAGLANSTDYYDLSGKSELTLKLIRNSIK